MVVNSSTPNQEGSTFESQNQFFLCRTNPNDLIPHQTSAYPRCISFVPTIPPFYLSPGNVPIPSCNMYSDLNYPFSYPDYPYMGAYSYPSQYVIHQNVAANTNSLSLPMATFAMGTNADFNYVAFDFAPIDRKRRRIVNDVEMKKELV